MTVVALDLRFFLGTVEILEAFSAIVAPSFADSPKQRLKREPSVDRGESQANTDAHQHQEEKTRVPRRARA